MNSRSRTRTAWLLAFMLLLLLAVAGCATPTRPDVGAVVIAPKVQLPPMPTLVQQNPAYPAGFFLQSFLDFLNPNSKPPNGSTAGTLVAAPTPSQ